MGDGAEVVVGEHGRGGLRRRRDAIDDEFGGASIAAAVPPRGPPHTAILAIRLSYSGWQLVAGAVAGVGAHVRPVRRVEAANVPGAGRKLASAVSSALIRTSIARRGRTSAAPNESGWPSATRICSATRSTPVTSSVTGCSTWMRVFISRKNSSSPSTRNSTVPALV